MNEKMNTLKDKRFNFDIRIAKLYTHLINFKKICTE